MNKNTNIEDKLMLFRKNLKYLREKHGLTQTQLANILGINSKDGISDLETGRKNRDISVTQLIILAEYFEISTQALLFIDLEKEDDLKNFVFSQVKHKNNRKTTQTQRR